MISSLSLKQFYAIIFIVLAAFVVGLVNEFYWIYLLPVVAFVIYLAFYRLDWLMLFVVFITPLSINLQKTGIGIGVSLPAEPLIFAMMLIFFLKLAYDGKFDSKIVSHPVSLLIMLHLIWMCVATLFSTIIVVSIKATLARICFVTVYYYLATQLFRDFKNIKRFIWLYVSTLIVVIIYTLVRHAGYNFDEKTSHYVMNPFYNDHTAYAVVISLFLPVVIAELFDRYKSILLRIIVLGVAVFFVVAIVASYTRAAWISLAGSLIASLAFLFRIRREIIIVVAGTLLIGVISQWTSILIKLESNTEKSSTDYRKHLESISNISSDASNVERVNRWLSALRMFDAKPVFGWGPGTYQFQYAPFQRNAEKTFISTNEGDRGSAHSEYLGPLAEEGLLGGVFIMLIAITVIYQNSKYVVSTKNKQGKILAIGIILGLASYWVHGFLNYFLDTDKASVPFWGFIAALVAMQVYHNDNKNPNSDYKAIES